MCVLNIQGELNTFFFLMKQNSATPLFAVVPLFTCEKSPLVEFPALVEHIYRPKNGIFI